MLSLVVHVLSGFLSIQDLIEDIVCVQLPISREKRHHVTRIAILQGFRSGFLAYSTRCNFDCRLIVFLHIFLHVLVLLRIIFLLEVSMFSKNLIRKRDFITVRCTIQDVFRLKMFVTFQVQSWIDCDIYFTIFKRLWLILPPSCRIFRKLCL